MDERNIASPLKRLANNKTLYSRLKNKYFTRKNARVAPNVRENRYGPNYNTLKKSPNPTEGPVPIQSLNLRKRDYKFDVYIGNEKKEGVAKNKGTSNNAKRIFKQNFKQKIIKESVTIVVSYATGNKESFYEGTWWKEIQARLKNENCTETEAIYLYDLLITTFIVSFLTGILNINGYQYNKYLSRNIDNLYSDLEYLFLSVFAVDISVGGFTSYMGGMILIINAVAPVTGTIIIGIVALIAVTSLTGYGITKRRNNQMSDKIFELSHEILKCMFNDDNKIKIAELKDKLYFWFLSKKCIDYIFDVGLGKIKEVSTIVAEPITIDRNNNNTAPDCGICLNKLNNGTKIKTLLCEHQFHDTCIEGWFKKSRNRTCPLCRAPDIPVNHEKLPVNKNFDEMVDNYKGQFRNFLNNMREILFFEKYDIAPVKEFSDEVIKYAYTQYDTYNKSTLNELNIPMPERPTNNSDENAKLAYKNAVLKYGEQKNRRSTSRNNRASNEHLFTRNEVNAEALADISEIEEVPERLVGLLRNGSLGYIP